MRRRDQQTRGSEFPVPFIVPMNANLLKLGASESQAMRAGSAISFHVLLCSALLLLGSLAHGQSIIQLGLIVDASSSTDEELPTFRRGVGDALATLKTDGSLELTLTQFSAEGLVIFGPAIIDSDVVRQEAVGAALGIDPEATAVPPFNGGTNLEDAFLKTLVAMQASADAGRAGLQFVNMLSDGHPTSHNHLGFSDIDEFARHQRGQTYAREQRDALITAGVDVISFEALGSSAEDLDFLKTLAYPEPAVVVSGSGTGFPSPITTNGFLLPVATVDDISTALKAKFAAAGFATTLEPDALFGVESVAITSEGIQFAWTGSKDFLYQVEYSGDMQQWSQDLPNSRLTTTMDSEGMHYAAADLQSGARYYRIVRMEK